MLLEQVQKHCVADCALQPGDKLLVGVSGGPDSLCLLDVLIHLGYQVIVAHFNHALRPEADIEAQRVEGFAKSAGLRFVTDRQDIRELADREGLSLEEAARTARYRFLFAQARSLGAAAVAVGHTADDQVETTLMHLLRGAGLNGLTGMRFRSILPEWDAQIPLLRPLLAVWHEETIIYCNEHNLLPSHDPSNQDTVFFRNRLRHELIPFLQGYNPRVKEAIWRAAQSLSGDALVLEEDTRWAWEACEGEIGLRYSSLKLDPFRSLPTGLQRRLLRHAVSILRPALRDLDFETVERGIEFAISPASTGQTDFALSLCLFIQQGSLYIAEWGTDLLFSEFPRMAAGQEFQLDVPGTADLSDGWRLKANFINRDSLPENWREDPSQVYLDAANLTLPVLIRTPRPGDRFQPLGMGGKSLKLSDFWVNNHVPRLVRAGWPLVFSAQTLAWVPLYRPADPFQVTESTQRILHLQLLNINHEDTKYTK